MSLVNIDSYMAANPSKSYTTCVQEIVDMRKGIFVPETVGFRPNLERPILFKEMLQIVGEQCNVLSYNNGSGPVYRPWSNISAGNLNGRPMFCAKEYYLDCDNVYRATPTTLSGFSQPYTNDTPLDADEVLAFVGNQEITLEGVALYSNDSYGCVVQAISAHPWEIKKCAIAAINRGLLIAGSFRGHLEQCDFSNTGVAASWFNLSTAVVDRYLAGTASPSELASVNVVLDRIRKAYLLHIAGNATVLGVRINSGYTGMVVNGNNCLVLQLAIERCLNALVIGGYPNIDPDALHYSTMYNPALAPKPANAASGCLFQSLGFESNWGGVETHAGTGNRYQDWVIIGDNCRDLAGRDLSSGGTGLARWGINNISDNKSTYDGLNCVVNELTPSKHNLRSIANEEYQPFVINETQTLRQRIEAILGSQEEVESLTTPQKTRIRNAIGAALQQDTNEPTP